METRIRRPLSADDDSLSNGLNHYKLHPLAVRGRKRNFHKTPIRPAQNHLSRRSQVARRCSRWQTIVVIESRNLSIDVVAVVVQIRDGTYLPAIIGSMNECTS